MVTNACKYTENIYTTISEPFVWRQIVTQTQTQTQGGTQTESLSSSNQELQRNTAENKGAPRTRIPCLPLLDTPFPHMELKSRNILTEYELMQLSKRVYQTADF